ncbi:lipopolysaccharide assembly protein LapB [Taylorella equigenitalis]|uniref:Lipopolysaccharide assembly protein B n=2 Tax=Taylorella equigenitalis TaxID=29575 RepID=I7IIT6_9BURK|nr:lipopolysaccharide assembly protein LapB [Taylorella equigenitalis]AFN35650.1 putative tricopeptide repeat protein [Taylorella equigenitalis ATCC 35865]ASY30300.1 lipopolysaccharide assembly protein LapB [Taylorella equigenitalis]ASY39072.1 lipopolysaccharide assembly protein LapB [Taylorella equigenitalis]ASY40592.1 lipopolysaccharide assembly protein LapB [Taylorella equigenitalis]KOS58316.1 heat-shock protein [Taylorella equigenitalis]
MNFEFWYLIFIPIFFVLGWYASRIDTKHLVDESSNLPNSYFKGLNFLLKEDYDRAIDSFVEVAKLDTETTELHFALGSLFRRRGEIDRSIRVHQSLLNRPDLPAHEASHARFELAQDYFKAGLLDRAEVEFKNSIKDSKYALPSYASLLRVYEITHDWELAIETLNGLQTLIGKPLSQIVHYYCEIIEDEFRSKNPDLNKIKSIIEKAHKAHNELGSESNSSVTARLNIVEAKIAKLLKDTEKQKEFLLKVLEQAPEFGGLVAFQIMDLMRASNHEWEGFELLRSHYDKYPSIEVFSVLFDYLVNKSQEQALDFAKSALVAHPSILALNNALSSYLKSNTSHEVDNLVLLKKLISAQSDKLEKYTCNHCGFQAKSFYWQCPGCNNWNTFDHKRVEDR